MRLEGAYSEDSQHKQWHWSILNNIMLGAPSVQSTGMEQRSHMYMWRERCLRLLQYDRLLQYKQQQLRLWPEGLVSMHYLTNTSLVCIIILLLIIAPHLFPPHHSFCMCAHICSQMYVDSYIATMSIATCPAFSSYMHCWVVHMLILSDFLVSVVLPVEEGPRIKMCQFSIPLVRIERTSRV